MDDVMTREAGEHIDNLNRGLHVDDDKKECRILHGDITRAVIWVIRQIEAIFKKIEEKAVANYTTREKNGWRIFHLPFGIEIPMERGFAPRDALFLTLVLALVYIIVQFHRNGIF